MALKIDKTLKKTDFLFQNDRHLLNFDQSSQKSEKCAL